MAIKRGFQLPSGVKLDVSNGKKRNTAVQRNPTATNQEVRMGDLR
jgi:hypothetical protein